MSLCVLTGAKLLMIATASFTLQWTHSVEKIEWRENWRVGPAGLRLIEASVRGSGAGMEPGDGAVYKDGWWTWKPDIAPQQQLVLAASGATPSGWTLCAANSCRELGRGSGPAPIISVCP
ncbi:DUF1850 domain-containing protein [Ensifer sp. 4252]|uniref:DUF1850 domain-containing protein n=1 Tax=Ensifer sp. 4252 TaxID=3373915 RepID=UPI003D23F304